MKNRLDEETIALRAAREFHDGFVVNLGYGMPGLCANLIPEGRTIYFQSENGMLGYGGLATDEEKDYVSILGDFQKDLEGTCVYCNHCLPCPSRIDVGATLRLLAAARHGVSDQLRVAYDGLPAVGSDCIACGDCMARCPFDVDVIAKMEEAAVLYESA